MERETFTAHLSAGTKETLELTRIFILDELPDNCRYRIYPNSSYDGNPLVDDEELFPGDSLPEGQFRGPMYAEAVVAFLWRNGKVPEWINMQVFSADSDYTTLDLTCCGRFTQTYDLLYYVKRSKAFEGGIPPFGPKGPRLPNDWITEWLPEWRKIRPDAQTLVARFGRFSLARSVR